MNIQTNLKRSVSVLLSVCLIIMIMITLVPQPVNAASKIRSDYQGTYTYGSQKIVVTSTTVTLKKGVYLYGKKLDKDIKCTLKSQAYSDGQTIHYVFDKKWNGSTISLETNRTSHAKSKWYIPKNKAHSTYNYFKPKS